MQEKLRIMTKQEIKCVMSFSVYKHFDDVLNAVENDGLDALNKDEVQKALTEMDSFLPPLSNVAKLVFCYHCVYQLEPKPVAGPEIGKAVNLPTLYLEYTTAWNELTQLGLLMRVSMGYYMMPQKVLDAVAVIDMEYYWPQRVVIAPEHKKEVFWRWYHE